MTKSEVEEVEGLLADIIDDTVTVGSDYGMPRVAERARRIKVVLQSMPEWRDAKIIRLGPKMVNGVYFPGPEVRRIDRVSPAESAENTA